MKTMAATRAMIPPMSAIFFPEFMDLLSVPRRDDSRRITPPNMNNPCYRIITVLTVSSDAPSSTKLLCSLISRTLNWF
jgi:hypothetical protein